MVLYKDGRVYYLSQLLLSLSFGTVAFVFVLVD